MIPAVAITTTAIFFKSDITYEELIPSGLIVSACACMLLSDITYEELIPAAVS